MYLTMDACFGLVRKKSASKHVLPSRHGDLFFIDQDNVDHFVHSYKHTKVLRKVIPCFLYGHFWLSLIFYRMMLFALIISCVFK